jgi:hypothetical protein
MRKFFQVLTRVNWWAISSVIFLLVLVILAWPPGEQADMPIDWIIALASASIVSAIFAVRAELEAILEALRRR